MEFVRNGLSLREALSCAARMGLTVRYVHGTGEWLIHDTKRSVRHNARRKVASRALIVLLRRAARRHETLTGQDSVVERMELR